MRETLPLAKPPRKRKPRPRKPSRFIPGYVWVRSGCVGRVVLAVNPETYAVTGSPEGTLPGLQAAASKIASVRSFTSWVVANRAQLIPGSLPEGASA